MENANPLGEFLRARRARVAPDAVGLPQSGTRRVPGLRREEVADLAGLSADYYTRLEQGRERHPSPAVLHSLARVLSLEPEAQRHLFALTTDGSDQVTTRDWPQAGANLLALMDEWVSHPALVLDLREDIVAANHLGRALFAGHRHSGNMARLIFLDADAKTYFREWDKVASSCVAGIRAAAGRAPDDRDLMALIGELTTRSDAFSGLWAKAEVRDRTSDTLRVHHPLVGDLDLVYETLRPNGNNDVLLKVYRPEPGSNSRETLGVLGSLTAGQYDGARIAGPRLGERGPGAGFRREP